MKTLQIAKKIITEEVEKAGYKAEVIYLFGSRARGDYKEYSDYDFYVIVDTNIEREIKISIAGNVRRKLRSQLNISSDILIQSINTVNERRNDIGYITYYALKEGVSI
ncbi:MAG: nucleotidyltransferase domain-containing protein [bacterium]